ncbi:hypothetical protein [uncultured Campylobacter sp.]|uniref:hypothetical protein n=1 Tax=uncultured Campylobacter sp. TaxID=218934 RepID=UPI0026069E1C|nr:hypothetical protein [uncultured Campylobacter sp.]
MHGLSTPCRISHVVKSRRNCARYKSSQTRRGSIAEAAAKLIPRDKQGKQAVQGASSAKQTAYGKQHKTETRDGQRTASSEKQMACTAGSANRQMCAGLPSAYFFKIWFFMNS